MIGEVRLGREFIRNGFDYQVVDVPIGDASRRPMDYEGYSGSGTWQI